MRRVDTSRDEERDDDRGVAARTSTAPSSGAADACEDAGWWPHVNLVYLLFVFVPLWFSPAAGSVELVASVVAAAVFLPLHYYGYRAGARARHAVLAAIALLGYGLIPINPGGNTFIIYAIAFLALFYEVRTAVVGALLLLAGMAAVLAITGQPWPFLAITAIIGAVVLVGSAYGRAYQRRNAELKLTQDEVRRLAATAERERIGRDLHDLLGHTLSLIALKSELANKLFERDPQAARAEVREVERVAREALGQVRRAVSGIRAAGLRAELANARLAVVNAGLRLDYRIDQVPLAPEVETALALAVRESVTNTLRHARAGRIEVELVEHDGRALLRIADDGRGGIDGTRAGNGLAGMRERLAAVGGALEIDSPPGGGTRLRASVPMLPPDADAAPSLAGDAPRAIAREV